MPVKSYMVLTMMDKCQIGLMICPLMHELIICRFNITQIDILCAVKEGVVVSSMNDKGVTIGQCDNIGKNIMPPRIISNKFACRKMPELQISWMISIIPAACDNIVVIRCHDYCPVTGRTHESCLGKILLYDIKTSRIYKVRLVYSPVLELPSTAYSNFPVIDAIFNSPIALVIWISRGQAFVQL